MDERLLKAREILKNDFSQYAEHALFIRTKDGDIVNMSPLKTAQQMLHDEVEYQRRTRGYVRIICLKARQQGISTYIEGRNYAENSQRIGGKSLILTHKADSTDALWEMTRRFHDRVPVFLKPATKYSSKKELFFRALDSQITVATAGGYGVARGETNTFLHASEMAFWPKSTAREMWTGLRQTVADKDGTFLFIESTANGMGNLFHDLCIGAYKKEVRPGVYEGDNEYTLVFIPWFLDHDYELKAPDDFERTPEEVALAEKFPQVTDRKLYWRRIKIAEIGPEYFMQEYPATVEEAFIASGKPVFDQKKLSEQYQAALKNTSKRYSLSPLDAWEEDVRGELSVIEEPVDGKMYVIGADVSKGIVSRDTDWSVAQVLDENKRLVATLRCQKNPDYYATQLAKLGEWYNIAELGVENNDHGILTCWILQKVLNYPYIYQTVKYDEVTDKESVVVGFSTNVKTKPLIIDQLRASLRLDEIEITDLDTLREMMTYIVNEKGKLEAEDGKFDDCVMALAIANHLHKNMAAPVKVTDDMYADAID